MAKTKQDVAEEPAAAPKKVFLSIYNADGSLNGADLLAINKEAQAVQSGAKSRQKSIMKRVTELLGVELKRGIRT